MQHSRRMEGSPESGANFLAADSKGFSDFFTSPDCLKCVLLLLNHTTRIDKGCPFEWKLLWLGCNESRVSLSPSRRKS